MATKSSSYWKKRFSDLENAQNQDAQKTFHQIEPAFDKAQRQIDAQIESWFQRYAKNNGITMAEARRQLSAAELKELKWDVREYIQYGQENAINEQWMKELENASARFHISRLEALKIRTQNALEVAFGNELDAIDGMMKRIYQSGYYHTCFELQKGFNIGWEIGQIDERKLQKVISRPWASDGKVFSDRVWGSKTSMVNTLHQELTRTIIQGKAPDEAIKHMTKFLNDKTKNAKYQAGRLVMTEQAFISSAAQKDAFNDLDVEEFEIVATLDSHTSDICQNMDGQHFPMKDYEPGVTAPPFHVWCRSTTVPYFDDEFALGERAARGEDGKTYYVPSNMTYPEWKKSLVDGDVDDLQPVDSDGTIKDKPKEEVFTPATTVEEAIEKTSEFAAHVDLKGVKSLDSLNALNKTLQHLTTKYPISQLQEITSYSRGNASAKANFRKIEIKTTTLNTPRKSLTDWDDIRKSNDDMIAIYENMMESKNAAVRRQFEKALERLKEENKYFRFGVVDTHQDDIVKTVITHEYGHVLADQFCGQINGERAWKDKGKLLYTVAQDKQKVIQDAFKTAKSDGFIYKLSKYGSSNAHEFFSESFAAMELGEDVPDYIIEMFRKVLK